MSARSTTFELENLRREWDRRARTAPGPGDDACALEAEREIIAPLGAVCHRQMRVLEIGCGAGRMTRALGETFGAVYAADLSGEMADRARLATADLPNVRVFQTSGRDLDAVREDLDGALLDLAVCFGVFEHVSRGIVEDYVRETGALLRAGGVFQFRVLGSAAESGCGGARFTVDELREMAERYGFEVGGAGGAENGIRTLRWVRAG